MDLRALIVLCATAVVAASPSLAGTWAGKETTKDGIVHVTSPATPFDDAAAVTPQEMWRAGGDDEDVIFGVVREIAVDDGGNVYLLDIQLNQIHVFDRDGNFVRDIGREGEGPGEFRRPSSMFILPDGRIAVVQMMPGKIILLNPDGTPGGDFKGPAAPEGGMQMFFEAGRAGNSVVLGVREMKRGENSFTSTRTLHLLDAMGASRAKLSTATTTRDMANMSFDEKEARGPEWTATGGGRVFMSDEFDAYRIKRFTAAGTVDRVFERPYPHRARSKQEIEDNKPRVMIRGGGGTHRPETTASTTDRDILRMFAREDGSLWVLSSRGAFNAPKNTLAVFDVFDADGRFAREVSLRAEGGFRNDGIEIVGDYLFVVRQLRSAERAMNAEEGEDTATDEDAEPMSIVCYRITPSATARK
ncbi:MAG TPA: 6-bladed beta-propeller [Candidatus Krumholzibacteria bacterium]|nr:6-bladed beta-propeller [Candidatus Krumholzibacteria bacterium]